MACLRFPQAHPDELHTLLWSVGHMKKILVFTFTKEYETLRHNRMPNRGVLRFVQTQIQDMLTLVSLRAQVPGQRCR